MRLFSLQLKVFSILFSILSSILIVSSPSTAWSNSFPFEEVENERLLDWDEKLFSWETFNLVETSIEAGEEFTAITRAYGPLVVQAGSYQVEASNKPWSSWWYPYWKDDLFLRENGKYSILGRYDRLIWKWTGRSPSAAKYEKENLYFPHQVRWSGRCDAWALASIMEPEPNAEVLIEGIRFRVRDQKALLLKIYEQVDGLNIFGQRFDGNWDSVYADVFPDQFHRFLQVELFQKKRPFIMDYDAGIEVWNVPVYKAITHIKPSPNDPNVMNVKTIVTTASPHVEDLDFVGTEGVMRVYTYDLYGHSRSNGDFVVSHGKWTGNSKKDHPDLVKPYPTNLKNSSLNKNIDVGMVRKIMKEAAKGWSAR